MPDTTPLMTPPQTRSPAFVSCLRSPLAALAAMGLGPLLAQLGAPPLVGFFVFSLAGLALLVLAIRYTWLWVRLRDRVTAIALLVSAVPALAFTALAVSGLDAPAIREASTDIDTPPQWQRTAVPDEGPYDREHVKLLRSHFPALRARVVAAPPTEVFARVVALARQEEDWIVTRVDDVAKEVEAVATTSIFRFEDDVIIRVTPQPSGSRIDMRSRSRVGGGDRGVNARRIMSFLDAFSMEGNPP